MSEDAEGTRKLPKGLELIIQNLAKAVLKECPVVEGVQPLLYEDKYLYKFASDYFAKLAERRGRGRRLRKMDLETVLCLAEMFKIEKGPEATLAEVLTCAEEAGLQEDVINSVTQLVLRSMGLSDDEDNVDADTQVSSVYFIALCISLIPSKGLHEVLCMCASVLKRVDLMLHAVQCFAGLDTKHSDGLCLLYEALESLGGGELSVDLLYKVYPNLDDITKQVVPKKEAPTPSSRPYTPVIVSHDPNESRPMTPGQRVSMLPAGHSDDEEEAARGPPPSWVLQET